MSARKPFVAHHRAPVPNTAGVSSPSALAAERGSAVSTKAETEELWVAFEAIPEVKDARASSLVAESGFAAALESGFLTEGLVLDSQLHILNQPELPQKRLYAETSNGLVSEIPLQELAYHSKNKGSQDLPSRISNTLLLAFNKSRFSKVVVAAAVAIGSKSINCLR